MQRDKLYNLHKTAYFIVAYFIFKMEKRPVGKKILITFERKEIEACSFYHSKEETTRRKPKQKLEFSQVFSRLVLVDEFWKN